MWKLLDKYLVEHQETDSDSQYYRLVATKLLSYGVSLPSAFINAYKRLNGAELLRLYLDYDLLEEAANLTIEYIDAVSGKGSEYFGLQVSKAQWDE